MKIKEYLKSKNPYLLASAAIVIVSAGIIIALLQEVLAEGSNPDVTLVVLENASESQEAEPEVHQHSWIFESYYQKPTCSNGGLVNQICAHCGETQITGGIPTGEHVYEVETVGDCCSAEVVVCKECNFREVREKDPGNHIDLEDGFCYGCGHKTD